MKLKIKRILACLLTACLTIVLLNLSSKILERKESISKYNDFFKQEEDFDVLFFGSSLVINGIFPMELWNDYGIVSYNFGGHSNMLPTDYWIMINALDYTTCQLVVIDCFNYNLPMKGAEDFSHMHQSLDCFPLTFNKIRAIWDLTDDPYYDNKETEENAEERSKIGLLWNYSLYHSRWNQLTEEDFDITYNLEKGAQSRIRVVPSENTATYTKEKVTDGNTGEVYLRKMIEECQKRGIEVLLTYLPVNQGDKMKEKEMQANAIEEIAQEYNVNYINFINLALTNTYTDYYDNKHLNPSGARKVTSFIGEYIQEQYHINDQRANTAYNFWNQDYLEYTELKIQNIKNQEGLDCLLMLLAQDDFDLIIDVADISLLEDERMIHLLENLGVPIENLNKDTDFIIIRQGGKQSVVLDHLKDESQVIDTKLGKVSFTSNEDTYYLTINDLEYNNTKQNQNIFSIYQDASLIIQAASDNEGKIEVLQ